MFKLSAESRVIRGVTHLCQRDAVAVDGALFQNFSVDSLMELAGLACAQAAEKEFPDRASRFLILAGPGNNGGDGLVMARHLHHFGYGKVHVFYPRRDAVLQQELSSISSRPNISSANPGANNSTKNATSSTSSGGSGAAPSSSSALFRNLVAQLQQLDVPVTASPEEMQFEKWRTDYDVVVDAIFGFSFRGWRGDGKDSPYEELVAFLSSCASTATTSSSASGATSAAAKPKAPAVVSVDIPSGWCVDSGPPPTTEGSSTGVLSPNVLISLTAPKLAVSAFTGTHYLGGRFLPGAFGLSVPNHLFSGGDQVAKLQ
eukprot:g14064.t1